MKFLFQNYIVVTIFISWISMVFKIILNNFICYVSCTPTRIPYCPKMTSPITFTQFWIFFLKSSSLSSFKTFYYRTNVLGWSIFYMDMYMVFAYYSFKNSNILRITNLFYQISTSYLNVTFENMITIFRNPNYMHGQPRNRMTHWPLFFHNSKIQKWVATESLALKVHSFN